MSKCFTIGSPADTDPAVLRAILLRESTEDDAVCSRPGWTLGPCRNWNHARCKNGYAVFCRLDEYKASRVSYRVFRLDGAPIPEIDGRIADMCHHCDNRACIEPKHLFAGSRSNNMQDALAKNRLVGSRGSKHTDEWKAEQRLRTIAANKARAGKPWSAARRNSHKSRPATPESNEKRKQAWARKRFRRLSHAWFTKSV
jgi:hypothetical protein